MPKLRGYLLAEAVVAGAVLAVAIGVTFSLIAQARADITYASNRATAAQIGRAVADRLASATACNASTTGFTPEPAPFNKYKVATTVANAPGTSTPAIAVGVVCQATVRVQYPTRSGSAEDQADGTIDGQALVAFTRNF